MVDYREKMNKMTPAQLLNARFALRRAIREVVEEIVIYPVGQKLKKPDRAMRCHRVVWRRARNARWSFTSPALNEEISKLTTKPSSR
jgi:hypothetical protein